MILALWIAVRMTFIALEGALAADAQQVATLSAQPPGGQASGQAGGKVMRGSPTHARQGLPPAHRDARFAAFGVPYLPRRAAGGAAARGGAASVADFAANPAGPPGSAAYAPGAAPGSAGASGAAVRAGFTGPVFAFRAAEEPPWTASRPADMQPSQPDPAPTAKPRRRRWSADGWVLARGGDTAPGLAAGTASYGGSQAGAVLRYAIAPSSVLRPQAYVRISSALGAPTPQSEAALGLMARPLRGLPLAVLGEMRLQDQGGPVRARPVVMAVTELAPQRLPLGFEGEAYGQGGWAGGRDATMFFDMAATLQRRVAQPLQGLSVSAGGGAWSGGQRGAARLDLGPRIELRGLIGPPARRIGVRVGVDWRFRVAGKAEPGSGPALTLAAGF